MLFPCQDVHVSSDISLGILLNSRSSRKCCMLKSVAGCLYASISKFLMAWHHAMISMPISQENVYGYHEGLITAYCEWKAWYPIILEVKKHRAWDLVGSASVSFFPSVLLSFTDGQSSKRILSKTLIAQPVRRTSRELKLRGRRESLPWRVRGL